MRPSATATWVLMRLPSARFVLADAYAPLIFVNGKDAKCAQLFTIVHELTHLALGDTGLFDETSDSEYEAEVGRFCDKVAAEFLMPADVFVRLWEIDSVRSRAVYKMPSMKASTFDKYYRGKDYAP